MVFEIFYKLILYIGVTTISIDPHKFGLGPKGVSVLLFKNK